MSRFPLVFLTALLSLAPLSEGARAQPPSLAASTLDLTPLQKALAPLAGNGLLQSRSLLQITGSKAGVSFTFHEQTTVVAKQPGKFRAAITQFAADGATQRKLIVVCDGKKVWTYQPGTRQYSLTAAPVFHAANDDMTALGLAQGGFFLGEGHEMAQGFCALSQNSSPQAVKLLNAMGIQLTVRSAAVSGEDDLIYRMVLSHQGIAYRFSVDPTTDRLRRVELSGRQNGVSLQFAETIQAMQVRATVSKTAFHFAPPPGAVRVPTLSVDPF